MFANAKKILITTETHEVVVVHKPTAVDTIWKCPFCGSSTGDPGDARAKRRGPMVEDSKPTPTKKSVNLPDELTVILNDFLEEEI